MTEPEYLDATKFPLSTQAGLGLESQMMIDAVNYDALAEAHRAGFALTPQQEAKFKELGRKVAAFPSLRW